MYLCIGNRLKHKVLCIHVSATDWNKANGKTLVWLQRIVNHYCIWPAVCQVATVFCVDVLVDTIVHETSIGWINVKLAGSLWKMKLSVSNCYWIWCTIRRFLQLYAYLVDWHIYKYSYMAVYPNTLTPLCVLGVPNGFLDVSGVCFAVCVGVLFSSCSMCWKIVEK